MLDLADGGRCMGGMDAIDFFERLVDCIDEEVRTPEFCTDYTHALNRLRYEVSKSIPVPVKTFRGKFTSYACGQCGHVTEWGRVFCVQCGRRIGWTNGRDSCRAKMDSEG